MNVTSVHVYMHAFSFETSTSDKQHDNTSQDECPYYAYVVSGQGLTTTSDTVWVDSPLETPEWRKPIAEQVNSLPTFSVSPYKQLRAPPVA